MDTDRQHLQLLSILHYVLGGLTALFSAFALIYVIIGIVFVANPGAVRGGGPTEALFVGWFFIAAGVIAILLGWTLAILQILVGRSLASTRRYTLCLVVAALECLCIPLGTALGVFTLVVLLRPSVSARFQGAGAALPTAPPGP